MEVHNRAHLLALAARLMRQVLVDHAHRRRALKRGGDGTMISLDNVSIAADPPGVDVLALDEALGELMSLDPRLSRIVELKFFAGLSISEAAQALGVSTATVERGWTVARAGSINDRRGSEPGRRTEGDRPGQRSLMESSTILRL
jgi:RNA polymerase sigma factor (TIGR02999 family)